MRAAGPRGYRPVLGLLEDLEWGISEEEVHAALVDDELLKTVQMVCLTIWKHVRHVRRVAGPLQ